MIRKGPQIICLYDDNFHTFNSKLYFITSSTPKKSTASAGPATGPSHFSLYTSSYNYSYTNNTRHAYSLDWITLSDIQSGCIVRKANVSVKEKDPIRLLEASEIQEIIVLMKPIAN